MKTFALRCLCILALLMLSEVSWAQSCQWRQEGARGPGWYDPAGGPCGEPQEEAPARYYSRWGAVATSRTSFNMGVAAKEKSRRAAERHAMERCVTSDCTIDITYHDQCVAVAWGDRSSAMASATTVNEAMELSLQDCREDSADCKTVYTDCSLAEPMP